jgi:erythronate-4-phosphate dehydrogenase
MKPPLHIVADENIPYVRAAFSHLGTIHSVTGRTLCRADIRDADMLLVRSVSRVDRALLEGTAVRFVGTATIGFDHIDRLYLHNAGIEFAYAPGSNAISAAEYVLSALLIMAQQRAMSLSDICVGIVGCGNVGTQVQQRLHALGITCLINDPPRQEAEERHDFVSLTDILNADIITLHVPLEKSGAWPTANLANADFFAALKSDAIFINTARGAVVDEKALLQKCRTCPEFSAILDVWRNEPHIDPAVLKHATLATPHIAGYSLDGKARGTEMLYLAACAHLGVTPQWSAATALPPPPLLELHYSPSIDTHTLIHSAVMACYDVRRDDAALRRFNHVPDPGAYFDSLRKNYPIHREFSQVKIHLPPQQAAHASTIQALGFKVQVNDALS